MTVDLIQQKIQEKINDPWWNNWEEEVLKKYQKIFHPQNLDNLTREEFKSFLLYKNNKHWDGIHRSGNIITFDMKALIRFLKYLLNENIPIKERLNTPFIEKGGLWIKGIGQAIMSAILLIVYPDKYGVWNSKSETALKKLNLLPKFSSKDTFADKYLKINSVLKELALKYNIKLWQLDAVLGSIVENDPNLNEKQNDEEELKKEAIEHGVSDIVNFGMESHLEDFLIANWGKTIFGKEYDLIYEDNELISQQYRTATGPIDILAISKDKSTYLVIELKKGRTSDSVFGQIKRYINWVKKHLAKNNQKVKGAIVVLETDENLKYSLMGEKDINLYTYKVDFKLNKENIIDF